jgi:hypothetical protein
VLPGCGIILMDATPVHPLTIYQDDVKDNTPATGNPPSPGYWGTDADWLPVAKVPLDQFPRRRSVLTTAGWPGPNPYGSDPARWPAARS